jgi:LysM repeat protein
MEQLSTGQPGWQTAANSLGSCEVGMKHLVVLVCVICAVVMCLPATDVYAQTGGTYVVQPGDTLATIAVRYGVTQEQLAVANGLGSNAWVYVGQQLTIPGLTLPPTPSPAPDAGTYVVQPGDTLYIIAGRLSTTVGALTAANGLANTSFIYVGQRLVIPGVGVAPVPPTATPAPTPAPNYGARWIDVNLTTQTLTAYSGQTPAFQTLVSTGLQGTPTVEGKFDIYAKYVSALMTGPGYYLPDVPYIMYFYNGYALHGAYWHNNFGQPMSHGCVNMATRDAQWLFNWADIGTTVVTHY